jgi:hypothetical protein
MKNSVYGILHDSFVQHTTAVILYRSDSIGTPQKHLHCLMSRWKYTHESISKVNHSGALTTEKIQRSVMSCRNRLSLSLTYQLSNKSSRFLYLWMPKCATRRQPLSPTLRTKSKRTAMAVNDFDEELVGSLGATSAFQIPPTLLIHHGR